MKLVSIDIETTGLDVAKHQVIEVGAVIFDTAKPLGPKPEFRFLLLHDVYNVDPYCAHLHFNLWKEISAIKTPKSNVLDCDFNCRGHCPAGQFAMYFGKWLITNNVVGKVQTAGKNFSSFDRQFLERLPDMKNLFAHRSLDPAAFFTRADDEMIPNLDTCCKRAGLDEVTDHTALADARLVVQLCLKGLTK